jgi:hypothetical protein
VTFEFAAPYLQSAHLHHPHFHYVDATTVTSIGFEKHIADESLPAVFALGGYQITARGSTAPVVKAASDGIPAGLQFDEQGLQVKLPMPNVAVTLQLGSCMRRPIVVVALDAMGHRVDRSVVPGDGVLYTITLVGTDLASLLLVGGGDGGRLVQICGASPTMQTILEDYFDPFGLPLRLLPYAEEARELFATYYLRPQELILQGRSGRSDGMLSLCFDNAGIDRADINKATDSLRRPQLGNDGFYLYSQMYNGGQMVSHGYGGRQMYKEESASSYLVPNWDVIRTVALTLPLTVAASDLLATIARAARIEVAEIPNHEWVLKKVVAMLVELGFASRIAMAAIPHLTADTRLSTAWLIGAGVLG